MVCQLVGDNNYVFLYMNQFEHLTISRRSKKEYGIWDLTQNLYKGKIQALEAKLGLFWDHFCNFLGLCSYFHEIFVNFETFWCSCISTYSLFVKNSKKIEFLSALSHCLGPIFAQLDPLFKIFGSPIDCGTVVTPWTGAEANSAIFRQATNGEDETRRD